MANPILIGGLIVGGGVAAWRLARRHRKTLRAIAERFNPPRRKAPAEPIRLEPDPTTGVYRPVADSERPRAD